MRARNCLASIMAILLILLHYQAFSAVWPINKSTNPDKITSDYGPRITGQGPSFHYGIDVRAKETPVYAIDGGTVTAIGKGHPEAGNYIAINSLRYLHLSENKGGFEFRESMEGPSYIALKDDTGNTAKVFATEAERRFRDKQTGQAEPVLSVNSIYLGDVFAYSGWSGLSNPSEAHLHIDKGKTGPSPLMDLPYTLANSRVNILSPPEGYVSGRVRITAEVESCQPSGGACSGTSIPDLNEVNILVDGGSLYNPQFDPKNPAADKSNIHLLGSFGTSLTEGIFPTRLGRELYVATKDFRNFRGCGGETGEKMITVIAKDLKGGGSIDRT